MGGTQNISAFRSPLSAFGNGIMAAFAPRMAAANAFRRQGRSGDRAVFAQRSQRIDRTGRRETAAGTGAEQKNLRRRNRPAINTDGENQNVLERVHDSVFEQVRASESGEKILFHLGKAAAGNGIARDENQFHRPGKLVLMPPETFAEQPPGAAANRRAADFFTGDHAESGRGTVGQFAPVGDEAAERKPLSLLPEAHEIAALREARLAAQTQAWRRSGGHDARKIIPA